MVIVWLNAELWTHGPKGGRPGVSACPASQPDSQPIPAAARHRKTTVAKTSLKMLERKKKEKLLYPQNQQGECQCLVSGRERHV